MPAVIFVIQLSILAVAWSGRAIQLLGEAMPGSLDGPLHAGHDKKT
jgi:hypothetical protein